MRKVSGFVQDNYQLILKSILAFSLAAGLTAFFYLGFFTRYGADDYCFTRTLFKFDNMWEAAWWWYVNTSNRYTTMFLIGISEWFGRSAISYLPALAVLLWTVGLSWALSKASTLLRFSHPRLTGFILAATGIFFTIWEAPNRYQSLYWRAGLVTYLTPLIFFSYLAGILLGEVNRPRRGWPGRAGLIALVAFGFFAAGGLSETTLAMQIGALGLALGMVLLLVRGDNRQTLSHLLGAGLLASLLGLLIVFLAPANQFRIRVFGEPPPVMVIILNSLRFAWDFMYVTVKAMPSPTFITFLGSLTLGWILYSQNLKLSRLAWVAVPLGSLLVTYLMVVCAMAPSIYGQGTYPGARSLIGAQFVLVAGTVVFALFTGLNLHRWMERSLTAFRWATGLMLLIMATGLLVSSAYNGYVATRALDLAPVYQQRAAAWDERDAQIRQAVARGERELTVIELDSISGIREYSTQSKWVNRCAAEFYGLETLLTYP